MANLKLSGVLSFEPDSVEPGGDAKLRLRLSSDTSLAKLLRPEGSIAFVFTSEEGNASYEHNYTYGVVNNTTQLELHPDPANEDLPFYGHAQTNPKTVAIDGKKAEFVWQFSNWNRAGRYRVSGELVAREGGVNASFGPTSLKVGVMAAPGPVVIPIPEEQDRPFERLRAPVPVTLHQAQREPSDDQTLWGIIRRRTINFARYRTFINDVLCTQDPIDGHQAVRADIKARQLPFTRSASYSLLKFATEAYLMHEVGLAIDDPTAGYGEQWDDAGERHRTGGLPFDIKSLQAKYLEDLGNEEGKALPYFKIILDKLEEVPLKRPEDIGGGDDLCYGILRSRLQTPPLMELIWSYWHEEGGLVQTMNALSLRFQNVRRPGPGNDPLANLAIDPLRPLNNIIWGYIEDERNRLTMNRRNLEYQYEYGFGLIGRGVQDIAVAEHRTFFLRGFHSLLRACTEFYQQANFTTVIPDGFPILNYLREVHLTLAEGAHNQFGDLPWTARAEMLTQQWILARPEVREFLGGRAMMPYTEPWMDRVDSMKSLQGWNPTNVTHFRDLGAFGEQLLLSIRYGSWNSPTVGATNAANWAHYWREEIQRYIHAYKAVTGIDLATDLGDIRQNAPDNEERYLQPAQLIERQNAMQQGQLRRTRSLNAPVPGLRPILSPVPRRRPVNE
ncbi:MAG: hypothetical protein JWR44_799 [Hymenobacter sp.]|jgi:hypothetical protein|nr:hypothetical protein [Hymenobacter sp.]